MNKKKCLENPHWFDSLNENGINNVCSGCCEDYKECGGLWQQQDQV